MDYTPVIGVAVELTGGMIAAVFTGLAFGGTGLGFILWKAHQIYMKLEKGEKNREEKTIKEENAVRDTLLDRYKQLYLLEKEESKRQIDTLRAEIVNLREEITQLRNSVSHNSATIIDLQTLNMGLQQENARLKGENTELKAKSH